MHRKCIIVCIILNEINEEVGEMLDIKLPSCEDSENMVIDGCISNEDCLALCMDALSPEMFFHGKNNLLFSACINFRKKSKKIDLYLIIEDLKSVLKDEERDSLFNHRGYFNRSVSLKEHIINIKETYNLRNLYHINLKSIKDIFCNKRESSKVLADNCSIACNNLICESDYRVQTMSEILENFNDNKSFDEYLENRKKRVDENLSPYEGVSSYYSRLDKCIGSFQNGCLHYIGARTSTGKTSFLLNLIHNIIKNEPELPMAFFTLEMTKEIISTRLLCMSSCIDFLSYGNMALNNEQILRMKESRKMINNNLFIDDRPVDTNMLYTKVRNMVKIDGVKIVFIDYLTLIRCNGGFNNNHEKINDVSKTLQALAKELKIPIICLAQLNRQSSSRPDKTPTLSDFRESGSIEEDADICMLLHRPAYYDESNKDRSMHLIIAKNRLMGDLRTIKYDYSMYSPGIYSEQKPIENTIFNASKVEPMVKNNTQWKR